MAKTKFRHLYLWLRDLKPHPRVQRIFRAAWAKSLAVNFDPDLFGILYVVPYRTWHWVFGGQHRLWAAKEVLGLDQKVYCRVYEPMPLEDLARIQRGTSRTKAWRHIEDFKLRLLEHEPVAGIIDHTLKTHGLQVAASSADGSVRATAACDWVIGKAGGPDTFTRVVAILHGAWGMDSDAYHQSLIRGVALLCNRYNGDISDPDLIDKLKKHSGPGRLVGRARDLMKVTEESLPRAAARVMATDYNKGRRTNRLSEWS